MAFQLTDFLPLNRGGTAGDGATGTYYVGTVAELKTLLAAVSGDAGNILSNGTDDGPLLTQADIQANETTTSLAYDAGTTTLTYTDEDGTATPIDLSALTTDIYVTGATITAGILTLTDNDSGTADVTVDLTAYVNSVVEDESAGTLTLGSASGSTTVELTRWMTAPLAP